MIVFEGNISPPAYAMEWRVCERFPNYEVSEFGDVRTCVLTSTNPVGFRPKPFIGTGGYVTYALREGGGEFRTVPAYRLVAEAFLGPCPREDFEVAHRSGSKISAYRKDLRWVPFWVNYEDRKTHHSSAGIHNGRAKLTVAQVREIRRAYAAIKEKGPRKARTELLSLCAQYGISESNADFIGRRETWAHIKDEDN